MLKTRELSVVIGAVLVLFCASAAFAGPPEYKLLDLGAEPEAPAGGGKQLPSLSDCFYGDQSLCDNLSQNVDSTFADSALRCAADEADVATGYWRLFDLDQDNSADPGLGFHADVNGVSVTGQYCIGSVDYYGLMKHINDQDNDNDCPGDNVFDPDAAFDNSACTGDGEPDACCTGAGEGMCPAWDDTEGPTQVVLRAFCLDEGLPFIQQFLDEPTEIGPFTVDCGGNPGSCEFGPQGQFWQDGGAVANPDGFECFYDGIRTNVTHCCDADNQDLAIELLTVTCCNGGDDGFGGQICGEDTDDDGLSDIFYTTCEFNIIAQNGEGETIPGYLGGGECLSEPVAFGAIGFPSLHLVLTVNEFVEPIPATSRVGAVLLVMILLGSTAYFFMRRRRVSD